ncbi:5,6-dimethylbenzimidazole synthase [Nocardioides sp. Arc9.136]|uniref:5,6-dimethylbenzimidazole synthase n=1 Tax=Nocardioides sp. Arc9.136 TaxID=2996826 RepID=UPI0026662A99|nr:5,6-dimethylbenzimidazole synthase [Nocardioides sp. Arc9.136]WKN48901.1 5,6-dimethylbenzimidazole synthase [Nocardioides sp. Arc9.136]
MELYDAIARRRDTRAEFTGPPSDEALTRVLEAANRAPSVGMSQPWVFVTVRDPARLGAFRDHVAAEREVFADSLADDPERAATFSGIKVEGIVEAGLGLVVGHDPTTAGERVLGRHAIADTGLYSVCLAIQNLWLAATAEGLGVGWVSFYREQVLADLVGFPGHVRPVAWLCVGEVAALPDVPDLERFGWRSRSPLVVHEESYAAPAAPSGQGAFAAAARNAVPPTG